MAVWAFPANLTALPNFRLARDPDGAYSRPRQSVNPSRPGRIYRSYRRARGPRAGQSLTCRQAVQITRIRGFGTARVT